MTLTGRVATCAIVCMVFVYGAIAGISTFEWKSDTSFAAGGFTVLADAKSVCSFINKMGDVYKNQCGVFGIRDASGNTVYHWLVLQAYGIPELNDEKRDSAKRMLEIFLWLISGQQYDGCQVNLALRLTGFHFPRYFCAHCGSTQSALNLPETLLNKTGQLPHDLLDDAGRQSFFSDLFTQFFVIDQVRERVPPYLIGTVADIAEAMHNGCNLVVVHNMLGCSADEWRNGTTQKSCKRRVNAILHGYRPQQSPILMQSLVSLVVFAGVTGLGCYLVRNQDETVQQDGEPDPVVQEHLLVDLNQNQIELSGDQMPPEDVDQEEHLLASWSND